MNFKDQKLTIGQVVTELPQAAQIFKDFNIDFCCGGHRLLNNVIKEQRINKEELFARLDQAQSERKSTYAYLDNKFSEMSHNILSLYIEDTHHSYLRNALPQTSELLATILRVHGKNHPELFKVYSLFGKLKSELEQHLLKEETLLFPAFNNEDKNRSEISMISSTIIKEHEEAGKLLDELRQLTNDYQLPADACESYKKTFSLLKDIESDIHQHIHLENNILLREYDFR